MIIVDEPLLVTVRGARRRVALAGSDRGGAEGHAELAGALADLGLPATRLRQNEDGLEWAVLFDAEIGRAGLRLGAARVTGREFWRALRGRVGRGGARR
ncbi:MAG: hypothetical protein AB7H93_23540 [Vicinamibacterales bacterium]